MRAGVAVAFVVGVLLVASTDAMQKRRRDDAASPAKRVRFSAKAASATIHDEAQPRGDGNSNESSSQSESWDTFITESQAWSSYDESSAFPADQPHTTGTSGETGEPPSTTRPLSNVRAVITNNYDSTGVEQDENRRGYATDRLHLSPSSSATVTQAQPIPDTNNDGNDAEFGWDRSYQLSQSQLSQAFASSVFESIAQGTSAPTLRERYLEIIERPDFIEILTQVAKEIASRASSSRTNAATFVESVRDHLDPSFVANRGRDLVIQYRDDSGFSTREGFRVPLGDDAAFWTLGRKEGATFRIRRADYDISRISFVMIAVPNRALIVVDVGCISGIFTIRREADAPVIDSTVDNRRVLAFNWGEHVTLQLAPGRLITFWPDELQTVQSLE
ncbi:FHA domain-containing protein [Plasmodiophora brassicae]